MLPDGVEAIELEGRGLRVGDVRFAVLLDEDAAGGRDALGPAEAEHPARGVEHVHAHVAGDAVAVARQRGQNRAELLTAQDGEEFLHRRLGQRIDAVGTTKGKGFAGVMKRHGFGGLRASHGVQRKHRSPGSIGGCSTPGRVFKGLRMAGHMGNEQVTTLNLEVVQADPERNLLLVKGSVPGPNGGVVIVRNAVKGK